MKPIRSFLYVFIILSGFLIVSYFMQKVKSLGDPETVLVSEMLQQPIADFTTDSILTELPEILPVFPDSRKKVENALIYPSGDTTVLYPFFHQLQHIGEYDNPLRILFFGDSQIEGDRITSTIRKGFQNKFGGAGIGLITPDLLYSRSHSFTVQRSSNWTNMCVSDFTDSLKSQSLVFHQAMLPAEQEGWFKIKQIKNSTNQSDYLQLKMFYSSPVDFDIVVKQSGRVIHQGKALAGTTISALNLDFSFTPASVELYFKSTDKLKITGFSLETKMGVQIDNIALRGFSYPPFSKTDRKSLEETIRLINPGLCILQFGVNIAPNLRENYAYYRSRLVLEIKKMKLLMPDIPMLIIGISDMAKKENGQMVSYSNINSIKREQMEAARICNCAFWDLEEYMGGAGAMIDWVNANPRLGQKDFVHFTERGTEKVGAELSRLILSEFEKYLKNKPSL